MQQNIDCDNPEQGKSKQQMHTPRKLDMSVGGLHCTGICFCSFEAEMDGTCPTPPEAANTWVSSENYTNANKGCPKDSLNQKWRQTLEETVSGIQRLPEGGREV